MLRYLSILTTLVGLAACSSLGASIQTNYWQARIADSFQNATLSGAIPVVVVGNPFSESDLKVAGLIANVSAGTYGGISAKFAASSINSGKRIVWHLSAPLSLSGKDLCAGPLRKKEDREVPARPRMLGAFCDGEKPLVDSTVLIGELPKDAHDEKWLAIFPSTLFSMIPLIDPFEDLETRRWTSTFFR